jgi:hypothetical protein
MNRRELVRHFMGGVATVTTPEESRALDQLVRAGKLKPATIDRARAVVANLQKRLPPPAMPALRMRR